MSSREISDLSPRRASKGRWRKPGAPSQLGSLVRRVYPSKDPQALASLPAFGWWQKAVPARVLRHARPVKLYRGTLYVNVSSAGWAHELHYLQEELLDSVQRHAPGAQVRSLRFQIGPLPSLATPPPPAPAAQDPLPDAQLPEEFALALSRLHDDALRHELAQAARILLGR